MCVRDVDDLCVLQFTLIIAAGCALHRRTSRVIHRIELYFLGFESKGKGQRVPPAFTPTGQQRPARAEASATGPHGEGLRVANGQTDKPAAAEEAADRK